MFAYILYNRSTSMVQLLYSPSTLFSHEAYCKHKSYIKPLKKLNKDAIDTKFIALPLIKWYFKINSTRCTFYSVASVVCDYHSFIIPPLAASVVCFDLFGREQDLSVAYSRERQSSDLTSSNKASLTTASFRMSACRHGRQTFSILFLNIVLSTLNVVLS